MENPVVVSRKFLVTVLFEVEVFGEHAEREGLTTAAQFVANGIRHAGPELSRNPVSVARVQLLPLEKATVINSAFPSGG